MAEPFLTITKDKLAAQDFAEQESHLGSGFVVLLDDPGSKSLAVTKSYKGAQHSLLVSSGKEVEVFLDVFGARRAAKMLNRLEMHYYGWPLTFFVDKHASDVPQLAYRCRDLPYPVTRASSPIRAS